jgi:hypothetical protein
MAASLSLPMRASTRFKIGSIHPARVGFAVMSCGRMNLPLFDGSASNVDPKNLNPVDAWLVQLIAFGVHHSVATSA